jgi:hypothetical protein
LVYLQRHAKSYIHSIYGSTDTLLYPGVNIDKVIMSLDLASAAPSFTFVSKRAITQDLGVSEDQFLDIGILCGFEHCPPFPPTLHEQALHATRDLVRNYKSGHAAVSAYNDHPSVKQLAYHDLFARTRSMIKYSLVLASEGMVQPLPLVLASAPGGPHGHHPTAADIPQDLHEIFTHRLPDELYFYLSRGLIGPAPLVWLTTGHIVEHPPLDNGETTEYKRFVKEVITDGQTGPRATALALISSVCAAFWTNRKVTGQFWFETGQAPNSHRPIQHSSQQTTQLAERVQGWSVPYAFVEEELRRQNVRLACMQPRTCRSPYVFSRPPLISSSASTPRPWTNSPRGPSRSPVSRRLRLTRRTRSSRTSSGDSSSCAGAFPGPCEDAFSDHPP